MWGHRGVRSVADMTEGRRRAGGAHRGLGHGTCYREATGGGVAATACPEGETRPLGRAAGQVGGEAGGPRHATCAMGHVV